MFILKLFRLLFILTLFSSLTTSCSGGGGGGDGGDGGGDSTASTNPNQDVVGIRVLSGAIDASPIDLTSSLDGNVQGAIFAEPNGFNSQISTGLHAISILTRNSGVNPIFTTAISHQTDLKHSFIMHGDRGDFGLRFSVISELAPEVPSGRSLVRIIHAATGASQLSVNSSTVLSVNTSATANFGGASEYVEVEPGLNTIVINRVVDSVLFDAVSLEAESGRAYSIFVAGEFGYFVTSRILLEN